MHIIRSLILVLVFSSSAIAQQAGPASKIFWDQDAPSLADAQGFTYKYYVNNPGTATGTFVNVICVGTASPFTCSVNVPALSAGQHSIQLTATSAGGESPRSTAFPFTFVTIPNAPRGLRLTQTP